MPQCKLLIPNPPSPMLLAWNDTLKQCGQLTLLLIDHNLNIYQELNQALEYLLSRFESYVMRNCIYQSWRAKFKPPRLLLILSEISMSTISSAPPKRQSDNNDSNSNSKRPKTWSPISQMERMEQLID